MPSSLLVALFFYYGYARTLRLYGEFGITQDMLEFSTIDYIIRSIDVVFQFIFAVLLLLMVGIALHHGVSYWYNNGRHPLIKLWIARLCFLFAFVGCCAFAPIVYRPGDNPWIHPLYASFSLTASWLLVGYTVSLLHRVDTRARLWLDCWGFFGRIARASFIAFFVIMVFVSSGYYAKRVGYQHAERLVKYARSRPSVTIYSTKNLGFSDQGIQISELEHVAHGYRYRYSGLKLLLRAGRRYFLFPENRSPREGIILLREDNAVRFEFKRGSSPSIPAPAVPPVSDD